MIAKDIVKELKTITNVTDIFWTDIFAWSVFTMKSWPFLVVSPLTGDTYWPQSEIWPVSQNYRNSFLFVWDMNTLESELFSWIETVTNSLWVGCEMIQSISWKRVSSLTREGLGSVVYNQERPTITVTFNFKLW